MPDNALLYKRVSTTKQKEEGTSLKTQEDEMRAYCTERGYLVAGVFEDDHSGADLDRPGLRALRKAVREGKGDVVVAYALDRLARDQIHQAVLLYEFLEKEGVRVEFVSEELDDTPQGRFLRSSLGFVAEMERVKIEERNSRGLRERAETGKLKVGGMPLYGYQWTDPDARKGAKGSYIPDPDTAHIVERIFLEVASGTPLLRLALKLNAKGIPTPTARFAGHGKRRVAPRWGRSTLSCIIRNPAYKGEHAAYSNKVVVGRVRDPLTGETRKVKRVARWGTESNPVPLPVSTCPPLVDSDTWQAANDRLEMNKKFAARNNKLAEAALLRGGFARCGYCGSNLMVVNHHGKPYYRCRRASGESGPCEGRWVSIPAEQLDKVVWDAMTATLLDSRNLRATVHAYLEGQGTSEAEREAQLEGKVLAQLTARHIALIEATIGATSEYHRDVLNQQADATAKQIEGHKDRLAQLQSESQSIERRRHDLMRLVQTVEKWKRAVAVVPYAEKRALLHFANAYALVWRSTTRGVAARNEVRWEIHHDITPERIGNCVNNSNLLWTQRASA